MIAFTPTRRKSQLFSLPGQRVYIFILHNKEHRISGVNGLLLRSVANASLTQEKFETVIVENEAIVNSRPLTPLNNGQNNLESLFPVH